MVNGISLSSIRASDSSVEDVISKGIEDVISFLSHFGTSNFEEQKGDSCVYYNGRKVSYVALAKALLAACYYVIRTVGGVHSTPSSKSCASLPASQVKLLKGRIFSVPIFPFLFFKRVRQLDLLHLYHVKL